MLTGLLAVLELLAIIRRKPLFPREKTSLQQEIEQTEEAIRKRKAEIEVSEHLNKSFIKACVLENSFS